MNQLQLRRAQRQEIPLRIGMLAETGNGKTYSALTIGTHLCELLGHDPYQSMAVIDSEVVAADLRAQGSAEKYAGDYCRCAQCQGHRLRFDFATLLLPPDRRAPTDYQEALAACRQAGIKVVIIDSITHEWEWVLSEVDRMKQRRDKQDPWGRCKGLHQQFMRDLLQYPGHVICTMRGKEKHDRERTDSKGKWLSLGILPIQEPQIMFEFDIGLFLSGGSASVVKTRAASLEGRSFDRAGEELARELLAWSRGPTVEADRARDAQAKAQAQRPDLATATVLRGARKGQRWADIDDRSWLATVLEMGNDEERAHAQARLDQLEQADADAAARERAQAEGEKHRAAAARRQAETQQAREQRDTKRDTKRDIKRDLKPENQGGAAPAQQYGSTDPTEDAGPAPAPHGFMDASCPKCGHHVGWLGTALDRPPCEQCGHLPDPAELRQLEDQLAEARQKILDEHRPQRTCATCRAAIANPAEATPFGEDLFCDATCLAAHQHAHAKQADAAQDEEPTSRIDEEIGGDKWGKTTWLHAATHQPFELVDWCARFKPEMQDVCRLALQAAGKPMSCDAVRRLDKKLASRAKREARKQPGAWVNDDDAEQLTEGLAELVEQSGVDLGVEIVKHLGLPTEGDEAIDTSNPGALLAKLSRAQLEELCQQLRDLVAAAGADADAEAPAEPVEA